MSWINEFNATFWLALGGSVFGSLSLIIRYMYKSKCISVKCCGFEIQRDVEVELRNEEIIGSSPSQSSKENNEDKSFSLNKV